MKPVVVFVNDARDEESARRALGDHDVAFEFARTVSEIRAEIEADASTLLIAREALSISALKDIGAAIARQPKWSHLPVILLMDAEDLVERPEILESFAPLGNVAILERPLRLNELTSATRACLAERQRQFEVRDLLLELDRSRFEAITAKEEAVRANRAKSEFLANMSHEIRTPLGALMGFSEMMAMPEFCPEERSRLAGKIKRSGSMLSALINDVLDLAKVESGNLNLESVDCSLDEILSDVVGVVQTMTDKKHIAVILEKSIHVPAFLNTDPARLKQVLTNLVDNAIKFTEKGTVRIKIELNQVLRELVFQIIDTGLGIEPTFEPKLFTAFSQGDSSITRKFGGTGLGLTLSRQLVRALGGELHLHSTRPGWGTTFEFSIPFVHAEHPVTPKENLSRSLRSKLKNLKILVADDSPDNQILLQLILEREGARVSFADDGVAAYESASGEHPDIVLMDMQMPRMSGMEATAKLRSSGFDSPIVALSAHALSEDRARGLACGCTAYLTKPVNRQELIRTIESVIPTVV